MHEKYAQYLLVVEVSYVYLQYSIMNIKNVSCNGKDLTVLYCKVLVEMENNIECFS